MINTYEKYQNLIFRYTNAVLKKPILAVKSSLQLKPCLIQNCGSAFLVRKGPLFVKTNKSQNTYLSKTDLPMAIRKYFLFFSDGFQLHPSHPEHLTPDWDHVYMYTCMYMYLHVYMYTCSRQILFAWDLIGIRIYITIEKISIIPSNVTN